MPTKLLGVPPLIVKSGRRAEEGDVVYVHQHVVSAPALRQAVRLDERQIELVGRRTSIHGNVS
jgi:hypothetical protein